LAEAVGRDLRFAGRLFDLGFGIVAGLYSGAVEQEKRTLNAGKGVGKLSDLAEMGRSVLRPYYVELTFR
jgi:hypothetical protein